MDSETNFDHVETMNEADTDADTPSVNEQVVGNAPKALPDESTDTGNTKGDDANEGVAALHALLEGMREDNDNASEADVENLRDMLSGSYKEHLNTKGQDGLTALHIAAKRGLVKAARTLIEAGAGISMQDKDERQPLHQACVEGKRDVAELLITKGADINARHDEGGTPLDEACWQGHIDIVALLLERRVDTNVLDDAGWSPLYTAATYGHERVVERLLRKDKSRLDFRHKGDNWTALHAAAYYDHEATVDILLKEGAKLDILDNERRTPLMTATRRKHEGGMRKLLCPQPEQKNLQLETRDDEGQTPLMWAAVSGFLAGVRLLSDAGANCNTRSDTAATPIITASCRRYREIVLALLEPKKLTEVDAQDEGGRTALHSAILRGHIKVVELLLKHKADVRIKDKEGRQALHFASIQGNEAVLKMLLRTEAGQQVDIRDNDDMTPLHVASAAGDDNVLKQASDDMGPDDLTPEERENPEYESGRHGAVVRLLLERGAKPKAKTKTGHTALHLAAECGDDEKLESILEYMDDVRAPLTSTLKTVHFGQGSGGFDALRWAAGNVERHGIAKLLIVKRLKAVAVSAPGESKAWGAIEWAAYAGLPKELWLLIATSPRTKATKEALELARKLVESSVNQSQESVAEQDQTGDETSHHTEDRQINDQALQDIIRDPPIALMCIDSQTYGQPTFDSRFSGVLGEFEAAVIQFYKGPSQFGSIRRFRAVREAIYDKGPKDIMDKTVQSVRNFIGTQSEGVETGATHSAQRPIYMGSKPRFTWVHLPSTNVSVNFYIPI